MKQKKDTTVLSTTEIFRVEYKYGFFERFMVQTYSGNPPFYYILKEGDRCPVETSNSDINVIINFVKRSINLEKNRLKHITHPPVKEVHEYCILKEEELLNKLVAYKAKYNL